MTVTTNVSVCPIHRLKCEALPEALYWCPRCNDLPAFLKAFPTARELADLAKTLADDFGHA